MEEEIKQTPRESVVRMLAEKYPDRDFENEDDLFSVISERDAEHVAKIGKFNDDQMKLSELLSKDPKVANLILSILDGKSAPSAIIGLYGKDIMTASEDEEIAKQIEEANADFLKRVQDMEKLEAEQSDNLEKSAAAIEGFKLKNKLSDDNFSVFLDFLYETADKIFMGNLDEDMLIRIFNAMNYEGDIAQAEKMGGVKERNKKIVLEKKKSFETDGTPDMTGSSISEENLTPFFGGKRRRSIWDV